MLKALNYLLSITKLDRSVLLNIFAYGMIGFSGMFTIGAALSLMAVLLYSTWQLKSSQRVTGETRMKV